MEAIKPNELRINNYVECEAGIFQVGAIREHQCDLIQRRKDGYTIGSSEYENLKPIELTEKWLQDFGFDSIQEDEENCNRNYTNTKHPQWWIQYHTDVNDFVFYGRNNSIEISIKSIHSLQNLYFALTGTELTLTPKQS